MKNVKNELILGCPDNPNSKAQDLFRGGNYLMCFQGGFDKFSLLLSDGGVVELHFQLYSEIPNLNSKKSKDKKEIKKIKEYVEKARKLNIDFMSHLPFMIDKKAEAKESKYSTKDNDGYFNFDFSWFVSPQKYQNNPTIIPAYVAQSESDKILNARNTNLEDVFKTLDLLNELSIELLTVHATKPGVLFNDDELKKYIIYLNEVQKYITSKNYNIKICVETGGLLPDELLTISKKSNTYINMDVAHFILDLQVSNKFNNFNDIEKYIINFIKDNIKLIKNMHLTQTFENIDAHKGVFENGIINCNPEVIKILNDQYLKGSKILSMIESKPDFRNFEYVHNVINNNFDIQKKNLKDRSTVTLIIGTAASGKSTIRKFLENENNISIESDKVHEEILSSAESLTYENFNEEVRQIGYNTILNYISNYIDEGLDIIVDATFDKKKRRKKLYEILKKVPNKRIYIIKVESNDVLSETIDPENSFGAIAIKKREKIFEKIIKKGEDIPFVLKDFEIYESLIKNYEPFDKSEFPNCHITYINTSDNTYELINKDTRQKIILSIIKDGYEKMGFSLAKK